ncbi:hypothetical protein SAMN05216352_1227 [Alteribacillus bidgolensis]|uniref:Uncharacterized protein n=1 Tax=Alteribacillus bidgolensis TaxID=930129 RepID=A0A1G8QV35_9BACI|nr:hypothetical protein SAMN05216352_1227 [Alteribacillus bidgolensis]
MQSVLMFIRRLCFFTAYRIILLKIVDNYINIIWSASSFSTQPLGPVATQK